MLDPGMGAGIHGGLSLSGLNKRTKANAALPGFPSFPCPPIFCKVCRQAFRYKAQSSWFPGSMQYRTPKMDRQSRQPPLSRQCAERGGGHSVWCRPCWPPPSPARAINVGNHRGSANRIKCQRRFPHRSPSSRMREDTQDIGFGAISAPCLADCGSRLSDRAGAIHQAGQPRIAAQHKKTMGFSEHMKREIVGFAAALWVPKNPVL